MSYFIFGDIDIRRNRVDDMCEAIEEIGRKSGLLISTNERILPHLIHEMIAENRKFVSSIEWFASTPNLSDVSDDIIDPFTPLETLKQNLDKLKEWLQNIVSVTGNMRLFVTEGYDNRFLTLPCSVKDAMANLISMSCVDYHIDSVIYEIT